MGRAAAAAVLAFVAQHDARGCTHSYFYPPSGPLPGGNVGVWYSQFYEADCSDYMPVFWTVTAGAIPPGLSLNPDSGTGGIYMYLKGYPFLAGTYAFEITADWGYGSYTFANSITIDGPPGCGTIVLDPPSLPGGDVGRAYSQTITASGGVVPYTFGVVSGSLPPGLTLLSGGLLSGTPSYAGTYDFWVRATDGAGCTGARSYSIVVTSTCSLSISPATLPPAELRSFYSQTLQATGGKPPYSFDASFSLPRGIDLSPQGVLSGYPTEAGIYAFTVEITDATACAGTQDFELAVTCGATIWPPAIPPGTAGVPYAVTLQGLDGSPPYSFHVRNGALPPGVSLAPTGEVSGTATAGGSFDLVVWMSGSDGCPAFASYRLAMMGHVDYVAGMGHGRPNANLVKALTASGTAMLDLFAYGAGTYGVNVASGDLDGDALGDLVTGPGPGAVFGPHVRAFDRMGVSRPGVNYFAYGTLKYGVNPAATRLDADDFDEILTAPGPGLPFGPHVRGWEVDGAAASPNPKINFQAYGTLHHGAVTDGGDVDGDGLAEILTAPGPGPTFAPIVRGWSYGGAMVAPMAGIAFQAFSTPSHGAQVRAGDAEADGYEEIACAPGPGPALAFAVRGFDYDDRALAAMPGFESAAFATLYGGRIGLGDTSRDARDDLVAGAGPDPAADATVKAFDYTGSMLVELPAIILPFPGAAYGVDVATGHLDYP